jgi:phenylacetate-CoA ligase
MRLDDPALDSVDSEIRDAQLVDAVRCQVAFMREKVPFWRERFQTANVDEDRILTLSDLGDFPILSKEELRTARPVDLLPRENRTDIQLGRWTSGTTGRPTANFWTEVDWAALVASTTRMLVRQAPLKNPTAFNGYSQGHLTGPLYNAALRRLGGTVYDRSHHPEDIFSTEAQMALFEFDTLVLPERAKRGKGIGLADILEQDPELLARSHVRWWIGSSGTFAAETVAAAKEQGVESVSNLYGSSEFGVFAVSCVRRQGDYHVAQGHVLVEVVDHGGVPVENGRSGRIVVTHLCGADEHGRAGVHRGTQIFRLANGDGATLVTDPCDCGLTAPRLRSVHRIVTTG